jgi:PTH1 family peptidyl-tRNA hydrolase
MKIIVALGNPGEKYKNTRHNAGWLVLDQLVKSEKLKVESWESKFNSKILASDHSDTFVGSDRLLLVKPQTFMNNSGQAVAEVVNFYKVDVAKDLLVIHDEIDLPFGSLRYTESSSPAGHNGVKDIIEKLGTQDFHRIRIGVESRPSRDVIPTEAFVLQNFTDDEIKKLQEEIFPKVEEQIRKFIEIN